MIAHFFEARRSNGQPCCIVEIDNNFYKSQMIGQGYAINRFLLDTTRLGALIVPVAPFLSREVHHDGIRWRVNNASNSF